MATETIMQLMEVVIVVIGYKARNKVLGAKFKPMAQSTKGIFMKILSMVKVLKFGQITKI